MEARAAAKIQGGNKSNACGGNEPTVVSAAQAASGDSLVERGYRRGLQKGVTEGGYRRGLQLSWPPRLGH